MDAVCADSLQPVLAVLVDEEAFTSLVLEPNKASVLHCIIDNLAVESSDSG